jgi:hypothetical protein
LTGEWVSRETRDEVVMFVQTWQSKTEHDLAQFTHWLGIGRSKYYSWVKRQGQENQPNGVQPKQSWLTESEKAAIITYYANHRQTGYRRLAYMMLDANVAAVSPSSVYRVLHTAGLLHTTTANPSKKGTGFHQPKRPHQHWHPAAAFLQHGTHDKLVSRCQRRRRIVMGQVERLGGLGGQQGAAVIDGEDGVEGMVLSVVGDGGNGRFHIIIVQPQCYPILVSEGFGHVNGRCDFNTQSFSRRQKSVGAVSVGGEQQKNP